jgi:protocatechuate 3,4-dioxygenase beta subunit
MGETRKKLSRREALGILGAASAVLSTAACGESTPTSPTTTATATATTTPATTTIPPTGTASACAVSPNETIGPYPSLQDFIRSDIREGKAGLQLNLAVKVVNANNGCAPVPGAVVDIWQCDTDATTRNMAASAT